MKRYYIITIAVCLAIFLAVGTFFDVWNTVPLTGVVKVGFIYENDESTLSTYNFELAQDALVQAYPDRVEVLSKNNVLVSETEEPLREMVRKGCKLIFTNSTSEQVKAVAADCPGVQFCQVSCPGVVQTETPGNFHTFNGEIYQGHYVNGLAAGMKLRALISEGTVAVQNAAVGFVGAAPTAEVISGYTAFLLGVRAVVPEAVLKVKYTGTWSNYARERACAAELIDAGCVVIAQNTPTIGPAIACEAAEGKVFLVGFNDSMIDVAPSTALVSTRVNWTPYILGAVDAVLAGKSIEKRVDAKARGNDMRAGFEKGWVEMLELNSLISAEGTAERMQQAIDEFRRGRLEVFRGDYTGVNPANPSDTCDLSQGYAENSDSSLASFHYVLEGVVEILADDEESGETGSSGSIFQQSIPKNQKTEENNLDMFQHS